MVRLRSATKRTVSEQPKIDADDAEATVESAPESDYEAPVKKRRRTGVATKKRKSKEYRGLNQLCIDELYIVFAYVYPMDLLNLARTCKYFRSFLMNKSSRFLWKDALDRVEDLPECPEDLTEPQYTNLVFYTRCHSCDKPAITVLWNLRRRYCSACKDQRLRYLYSCDPPIQSVLPCDKVTKGNRGLGMYVDCDKFDSLMVEYHSSADKDQFLAEKQRLCQIIYEHARECANWQRGHGRVKRFDLDILRKERQASIFERLRQHGFGPEIDYFDHRTIQDSYKYAFKQHVHLTDNAWEQMWPKWADIMRNYRFLRLDETCYHARRKLLAVEYDHYMRVRTPTFDLLPHVADLASFPPFRDIIEAPEESEMDKELFASAFAQLPALVDEWKQQLDIRLTELVEIPPHLTLRDTPCHAVESSRAESDEAYPKGVAKLHLACALFQCQGRGLFTYREVFFAATHEPYQIEGHTANQTGRGTTQDQVSYLEEIPYIVHACKVDPHVATADDLDRQNARLRCLACENSTSIVMDWRNAIVHASSFHAYNSTLAPVSESPRWQAVSDDHIEAIQAIEEKSVRRSQGDFRRCLLCLPRVGGILRENIVYHMQKCHELYVSDLKEGVHYERLGLERYYFLDKVEMVEEGGEVVFRLR